MTTVRRGLFEDMKKEVPVEEVKEVKKAPADSLYVLLKDNGIDMPHHRTADMIIPKYKWSKEDQSRVPEDPGFFVLDEEAVVALYLCIVHDMSLLMYGPAGCGKTSLPKWFCHKINFPFTLLEFNPGTEPEYHLGQMYFTSHVNDNGTSFGTEFRWGDVPIALSNPGLVVLDEFFKADPTITTSVGQSVLDHRKYVSVPANPDADGRRVPLHELTRVVLTSNTNGAGEDAGRFQERAHDTSTLSRISLRLKCRYLSKSDEIGMVVGVTGVDRDVANKIVTIAGHIRKSSDEREWSVPFTHRDTIMVAKLWNIMKDNLGLCFNLAYANALTPDEQESVRTFVKSHG